MHSDDVEQKVVFVSGLSGSGKTTAMAALEDLGFYCVDNLPAELTEQFLDLCHKTTPPIAKIALALDAREESFLRHFPTAVADLRAQGAVVEVIFLECSNIVLEKRYRETRRVHPLSPSGSVEEGIQREREVLADVTRLADVIIDTSEMNVHRLKEVMVRNIIGTHRQTLVNLVSFGFRHGTPHNLELLFDLRCLPNPYFEEHLKDRTGLDTEVANYVLESERGANLFRRILELIDYLLPLNDEEGKAYLTIGVGCTGGQHRSVAFAGALSEALRKRGRETNLEHRDVARSGAVDGKTNARGEN
ncbi:MAG: RNase adapter RapZ [Myxococcales bacterium]|nr:RNase adapter RapZ [Myxococcales bacterium]